MHVPKIPESNELLQIAMRKALKKARQKKGIESERAIIITFHLEIENKIGKAVRAMPRAENLSGFQFELLESITEISEIKKAVAHLNKSLKIISKLKKQHLYELHRTGSKEKTKEVTKRFMGRASSVIKRLNTTIKKFNFIAVSLKEMPELKELPTLLIAGRPNAGKTTLLNRITGAKAKIASYAFTTTKLNLGYASNGLMEIQIIDTPGLLDKEIEKAGRVERKALAALNHAANAICFVLDPTEQSSSIESQKKLLEQIKSRFRCPLIIFASKADISNKSQLSNAKKIASEHSFQYIKSNEAKIKEKLVEFCIASVLKKTSNTVF